MVGHFINQPPMLIEETRENARRIFEQWFQIYAQGSEPENRDRLFEYFHSGYLAGTRHWNLTKKKNAGCPPSLIHDDINRNLDL